MGTGEPPGRAPAWPWASPATAVALLLTSSRQSFCVGNAAILSRESEESRLFQSSEAAAFCFPQGNVIP